MYDSKEKRFSYAKKRVTNTKGNSRVNFPREGASYEDESILEMVRMELMGVYKNYFKKNCNEGGAQTSNLNEAERMG